MSRNHEGLFLHFAPGLFVLLWSTGFIGGKIGLPYIEPFTFLTIRFLLAIALLTIIALITNAPWPDHRLIVHLSVSGILLHTGYLGSVFSALSIGIPAGIVALIVGLQPLLTVGIAFFWFREKLTQRQLLGFLLGLTGVFLVVSDSLWKQDNINFREMIPGLLFCILGLFSITLGTVYQKRFGSSMDMRTGTIVQYIAAAVTTGFIALYFETRVIEWSGELIFALCWLLFVLSIGAISLLMLLIKQGAANQTAKLFYLVPPITALIAHIIFAEPLTGMMIFGIIIAVLGVYLARS